MAGAVVKTAARAAPLPQLLPLRRPFLYSPSFKPRIPHPSSRRSRRPPFFIHFNAILSRCATPLFAPRPRHHPAHTLRQEWPSLRSRLAERRSLACTVRRPRISFSRRADRAIISPVRARAYVRSGTGRMDDDHQVLLIVLNIFTLAFAARVNIFQEFYCEYHALCYNPPPAKSRLRICAYAWTTTNDRYLIVYADLFPLGLAVATLTILVLTYVPCLLFGRSLNRHGTRSSFALDLTFQNIPTARPAIEVGLLYVLSIFWLGTLLCALYVHRSRLIPACGQPSTRFPRHAGAMSP